MLGGADGQAQQPLGNPTLWRHTLPPQQTSFEAECPTSTCALAVIFGQDPADLECGRNRRSWNRFMRGLFRRVVRKAQLQLQEMWKLVERNPQWTGAYSQLNTV